MHIASPEPDFVGYDAGPEVVRGQVAEEFREQHRELQHYAETLRKQGVKVTALQIQGPTVESILDQADRLQADLIITGSHGKGALMEVLVGSVSQGVLRKANCPVLIVPTRPKSWKIQKRLSGD